MTKNVISGLCLAFSIFCVHAASAADPIDAVIYKQATMQPQRHLDQSQESTVQNMDRMLKEQYGSIGQINAEPDTYLRDLYQKASWLLLNGYPISGGTMIQIARTKPAFKQSAIGPYLVRFVDTLLAPTEDDGDEFGLLKHSQIAKQVLTGLAPLPNRLQMLAQLHVIGKLYHDEIAYQAGLTALKARMPSEAEWSVVKNQLDVVKQSGLPDPVGQ